MRVTLVHMNLNRISRSIDRVRKVTRKLPSIEFCAKLRLIQSLSIESKQILKVLQTTQLNKKQEAATTKQTLSIAAVLCGQLLMAFSLNFSFFFHKCRL